MYKKRIKQLQAMLRSKKLSALWVSCPVHVRYLSGFRMAEDAKVLITLKSAYIFTDFRYQNERDDFPEFAMVIWGSGKATDTVKTILKKERIHKLAYESSYISVKTCQHFLKQLKVKLAPTESLIEQLRTIKESGELTEIRKATRITDEAFRAACTFLQPGRTEQEVAWHIESYMRTHGAEALAFDCIVASGPNGDKPHAIPTRRKIKAGDFVTIDIGARVNGYHADMTRTVAVGYAPDRLKNVYELVRSAQEAGLRAVKAGVVAHDVDHAAREIITQAGYGEYFGHATGHGVGLEIHEAPSISQKNSVVLREGMVITVEPGIYLPNEGGVRIEDTVVITKRGYSLLTNSPKVLCIV